MEYRDPTPSPNMQAVKQLLTQLEVKFTSIDYDNARLGIRNDLFTRLKDPKFTPEHPVGFPGDSSYSGMNSFRADTLGRYSNLTNSQVEEIINEALSDYKEMVQAAKNRRDPRDESQFVGE